MKFIISSLLFAAISANCVAQTLFEDGTDKPNTGTITINQPQPKAPDKTPPAVARYLSTNLESLIARGDIQLQYEVPQKNGWSTMYSIHVNPQDEFNKRTGDLGVAIGGRMYLDQNGQTSSIFLQGLAGFNHYSDWDLMVSVELGQRFKWKKNIFLDLSLAVNRSYASNFKDPMANLKANLTFAFDTPILPFL